jgi:hypothetical protein
MRGEPSTAAHLPDPEPGSVSPALARDLAERNGDRGDQAGVFAGRAGQRAAAGDLDDRLSGESDPANNAIIATGTGGELTVYCGQASGRPLIVDVNGYFL